VSNFSLFAEFRLWFHAVCVANQSATQQIITCARCDEVIVSTDTTTTPRTISIYGKFQEVYKKFDQKRKMGTGSLDLP
jgi:hypothetical protein